MPMPKPHKGEAKDDFISRFMGDEVMVSEYPDAAQRRAVAESQWKKFQGAEMEEEIFSVGKWNGMTFTLDDLKNIVESFKRLKDVISVPLKLGHSGDADLREGQPSLGWVSDIWIDEQAQPAPKLIARFEDLPSLVMSVIKKRLYIQKSIELDFDVQYKGETFPYALTGVALLGADLPAVNTLNDLGAYLASKDHSGYAAFGRTAFSSTKGALFTTEPEEPTMSDKELEALKAELEKAKQEAAKFQRMAEDAQKADEERLKAEKQAAFGKKVASVRDRMEKMVEDKKLLPADRSEFSAKLTDEGECDKVSFALDLLEKVEVKADSAAFGKGGGSTEYEDASAEVAKRIEEELSGNPKMTYSQAQAAVFRKDAGLARKYITMT